MRLQHAVSPHPQDLARPVTPLSAIWMRGLVEAVDVAGIPQEEFLTAAGMDPDQLTQTYAWVEVEDFDRVLALAVKMTGDPAFGLHWSQRSPMNKFDVFAVMATHVPSLRAALDCLLSFQPILWKRSEIDTIQHRDSLLVRCNPMGTSELGRRVRAELAIYGLLRLLRFLGVPDDAVRRLSFAHAAPPYASEYTRVHPIMPKFGQSISGIEIADSWLDRPLGDGNKELYQVLKSQAHLVLGRIQRSTGYAGRVRDYLGGVLPHLPDMPEAARAMGLSVRSLRRRLADEGWSYTRIVEEAQHDMARVLLQDPSRSIKQVGFDVGFTTAAAFDRAFKRWTGDSPTAFRNAQLAKQPH